MPSVNAILTESALPPRLTRRVRSLAHRTRLRRNERAIAADLLCTEAAERLAEGESEASILATLRPKTKVARQLRRDLLKDAPARRTAWAVATWVKRSIATSLLATLLVYPFLFWRFHAPKPNLTLNLGAEHNAIVDAMPPEDRAAGVYAEAAAMFEEIPDKSARTFGIAWPDILPGDEFWPEARAYIDRNEQAIAMIRAGAARPHAGYRLSTVPPTDPGPLMLDPAHDWNGNPFWMALCSEPFGQYRNFARTLAADARYAAERAEPARVMQDVEAMLGLARHAGEGRSVIGDLVAVAIRVLTFELIGELVLERDGLFGETQLLRLAELTESAVPEDHPKVDLEIERLCQFDLAQRVFSDDGTGGGTICFEGLRFIRELDGARGPEAVLWLLGPLTQFRFATRREYLDACDAMLEAIEADSAPPMWEWTTTPGEQYLRSRRQAADTPVLLDALLIVGEGLQGVPHAFESHLQSRDATLVALALARYRRDQGGYPEHLDALVPEYLAALPPDRYDGLPLKYILRDGRSPVLYSIGADRIDNNGTPPATPDAVAAPRKWAPPATAHTATSGDWIILPKPVREPF